MRELARVSCRHNARIPPHCMMHMHDASSVAILTPMFQLSQIKTDFTARPDIGFVNRKPPDTAIREQMATEMAT